jgi:hypothetical protein
MNADEKNDPPSVYEVFNAIFLPGAPNNPPVEAAGTIS